jgi:hypothetical protein
MLFHLCNLLWPNVDQNVYGLCRIAIILQLYCRSLLLTYESARITPSPQSTLNSTSLATDSFLLSSSTNTAIAPNLISREITADCQISVAIEKFHTSLDHTSIKLLIAGTSAVATDALPTILGPNQLVIAILVQRCGDNVSFDLLD